MAVEVGLMVSEDERAVDPELGYPPGYAKLCRLSPVHLLGRCTPFAQGPPHRFLPYSPSSHDFEEWDGVFPTVVDRDGDARSAYKHAEQLWQQLDHLGNAGFDPAKFRVDPYGNVVYWNADPSSPLAWEVDHWFPPSRGGKTVVTNLRVVQWQAHQRKKNRLEFLVPWWDLQHGCSINQFLSAFASKDADFRKRSFALFFSGGEDASVAKEHVGECRPWPPQFREKKAQCGLAAAAIVMVPKAQPLLPCDAPLAPGLRRWSADEEEALKDMKENEPTFANRSMAQLQEKHRRMRVEGQKPGKENKSGQSAAAITLQKELRVKVMREEETREKEAEIAELEKSILNLKRQNEQERLRGVELEAVLTKHKRRVEKQRRWAETQSSYRLCLERMIRDTMHQSISYKEQARLNQAACNALKARLDCQKTVCEAAEKDLLEHHSQRSALNEDSRGVAMVRGRDIVDVSSCLPLQGDDEEVDKQVLLQDITLIDSDSEDETADEVYTRRMEHRRRKELLHQHQLLTDGSESLGDVEEVTLSDGGEQVLMERVCMDSPLPCPPSDRKEVIVVQSESLEPDTVEKEVVYKEEYLDELLQHVQFQLPALEDSPLRKSEEHLDELLQQVLATHLERIKKNEAGRQEVGDTDDEKVRQIGKQNLDKWLQVLLFNVESAGSSPGQASPLHRAFTQMSLSQDQKMVERPKGLWGVLLQKLSAKHQSEQCLDAEPGHEVEVQQSQTQGTTQAPSEGTILSLAALHVDPPSMVSDQGAMESALDNHFTSERRKLARALSDVDEISECGSLTSTETLENRSGLRASFRAAGLVWKKAVRKLETRIQDGPHHSGLLPTPSS